MSETLSPQKKVIREGQATLPKLKRRIQNYLANGGLFNPELMEHDKVRDLLIDIRDFLFQTKTK